jgi:molecular chaperone GrpE
MAVFLYLRWWIIFQSLKDTIMSKKQEHTDQEMPTDASGESALPVEEQVIDTASTLVGELEQQKDKFIRLLAEFENYKRRTSKERLELMKTAGQDIMVDLLPVLDDIDRAEQVIASAQDVEAIREGLKLIAEKLRHAVSRKGLKSMEVLGTDFDSEQMEAITEIPAGEDQTGKVVDVLERGYTLNDKIIRYAKVVVGK